MLSDAQRDVMEVLVEEKLKEDDDMEIFTWDKQKSKEEEITSSKQRPMKNADQSFSS